MTVDDGTRSDDELVIRDDIVRAAAHVFSQRGFHGTSMQDVADVLGMRKPSLYYHVRRKEDLLYAIHRDLLKTLVEQVMAALAGGGTPSEKLRQILLVNATLVAENLEGVNVLQRESKAVTGERWSALVARRDMFEQMVREVLKEGIRSGELVAVDPSLAAKAILSMPAWMATWYDPAGPLSAAECAQAFGDIVLPGLVARP